MVEGLRNGTRDHIRKQEERPLVQSRTVTAEVSDPREVCRLRHCP